MDENQALIDPTGIFIKELVRDARVRGNRLAVKLGFDEVMGKVFGNIIACGVVGGLSDSLWDSPMR